MNKLEETIEKYTKLASYYKEQKTLYDKNTSMNSYYEASEVLANEIIKDLKNL